MTSPVAEQRSHRNRPLDFKVLLGFFLAWQITSSLRSNNELCKWIVLITCFGELLFKNIMFTWLKPGLHCAVYSTFTPHYMCWKCFGGWKLLYVSLTKFNKLNLKRNLKINNIRALISTFKNYFCKAFALYLVFIFNTFSVYLWRIVWSSPVPVHSFFTRSQNHVLWHMCCLCVAFTWLHVLLKWLQWYFLC